MNEQELRHALRATMTVVDTPPPMSETSVLDAARQAQRTRKARLAGLGSAAAVSAIAVAAVVLVSNAGSGSTDVGQSGGTATQATTTHPTAIATVPGGGADATPDPSEDTKTSWPNGQTDRTARSGPQFERGEVLLGKLTEVVPAGFDAPTDLKYADPKYTGELRFSESQFSDYVDGAEVWEYRAVQPVAKDGGLGELLVQVYTPGNRMTGDGCALAPTLWSIEGGICEEKVVDGKRVGVFTPPGGQYGLHSWAGYRLGDGTVVFLAQSLGYEGSGKPALTEAPLSADRLAELAADPRFLPG